MKENVQKAIAYTQLVLAEKRLWDEERRALEEALKVLRRFDT